MREIAKRILLRLPPAEAEQVDTWAEKNWTSINAEVIRAIRERLEREQRAEKVG
jgi:hypothetical protein